MKIILVRKKKQTEKTKEFRMKSHLGQEFGFGNIFLSMFVNNFPTLCKSLSSDLNSWLCELKL